MKLKYIFILIFTIISSANVNLVASDKPKIFIDYEKKITEYNKLVKIQDTTDKKKIKEKKDQIDKYKKTINNYSHYINSSNEQLKNINKDQKNSQRLVKIMFNSEQSNTISKKISDYIKNVFNQFKENKKKIDNDKNIINVSKVVETKPNYFNNYKNTKNKIVKDQVKLNIRNGQIITISFILILILVIVLITTPIIYRNIKIRNIYKRYQGINILDDKLMSNMYKNEIKNRYNKENRRAFNKYLLEQSNLLDNTIEIDKFNDFLRVIKIYSNNNYLNETSKKNISKKIFSILLFYLLADIKFEQKQIQNSIIDKAYLNKYQQSINSIETFKKEKYIDSSNVMILFEKKRIIIGTIEIDNNDNLIIEWKESSNYIKINKENFNLIDDKIFFNFENNNYEFLSNDDNTLKIKYWIYS